MQEQFKTLKISIDNKVARVLLNRPEQHNAMNKEMILEITRFFRGIAQREKIFRLSFCKVPENRFVQEQICCG